MSGGIISADPIRLLFILGFLRVDAANLCCFNDTVDNPQTTPLLFPLPLIETGCINTTRYTKMFISGFNRNITSEESRGFISAYLQQSKKQNGTLNVLYLDWAEEAKKGDLGVVAGYIKAVTNTEVVGNQLAAALEALRHAGLNYTRVHLIGHSLGAQLAGICTRTPELQKNKVARTRSCQTGIRRPCNCKNGIAPICANIVDVGHSDPGGYGIADAAGTVDYWPNYQGGPTLQPGCPQGTFPVLSQPGLCSHIRSWMYYLETITNCTSFLAASEPDYDTWIKTNGTTNSTAYMGECLSKEARGNYYFVTNDASPYGKGDAGTNPNNRVDN